MYIVLYALYLFDCFSFYRANDLLHGPRTDKRLLQGVSVNPPKTRVNRPNTKPKNASALNTPTELNRVDITLLLPLYAYCNHKTVFYA
jgi:hypothetical protein